VLNYGWIIPAIPAVSFLLILLLGKHMPKKGSEIGIVALSASFILSCVAVYQWIDRIETATGGKESGLRALGRGVFGAEGGHGEAVVTPVLHHLTWWQNGGIEFGVGIRMDGLAVMMLFVVTLISLLVHIYSVAYLRDDVRYTHYYAMLSLFTAAMLTLVVADNTLQILLGWEGVGLCSYALIGHWWEENENSGAALKAFLTTRTGDIGLMIGIIILFFTVGSFDIGKSNLYALSSGADHAALLAAAVCLFIGIIGKSGQFPLHTWLPDAMAGPTPVSALIHAATMVVAGVYLGARLYPVFFNGFSIAAGGVNFMALIGGITIIVGAVLAFVQPDIKKVLAYSTISQLGYMVMALGSGAWVAAVFHLFTHAFFKALLFLGAGSVSHSGSHHSFDMKKDMGGLRKYMPITFWTFMIGSLALAGIFPFAGFWSKDEILVTAGRSGYDFFLVVGLVGAFLTAAYMTRCVYLTFFGEFRGHGEPHESERAITIPLVVLAVFSVLAGVLAWSAWPFHLEKFKEWVEPRIAFPVVVHPGFDYSKAAISLAVATLGIGIAAYLWFQHEELGPFKGLTQRNKAAHAAYTFLEKKYYLDDLYENVIVASIKGAIARASYWFDQHVVDAVVNGAGRGAKSAGKFTYEKLDQRGVDGAINGVAEITGESGGLLRYFQSGRIQRYALLMFAAVGLLSLAILLTNT
jgi:NADH-quinone oxidoreductase subunit L